MPECAAEPAIQPTKKQKTAADGQSHCGDFDRAPRINQARAR